MTVLAPSRPFRSFGMMLVGWIIIRTVAIWMGDPLAATSTAAQGTVAAARPAAPETVPVVRSAHERPIPGNATSFVPSTRWHALSPGPAESRRVQGAGAVAPSAVAAATAGARRDATARPAFPPSSAPLAGVGDWSMTRADKRWTVSAWLLVRQDGPEPFGVGGELGGSQAGARLFYRLTDSVAVTARVSRPLARERGGEASAGFALRHGNIGLLAERRIALDRGGRNAFSLTAYGGVSDVQLGHQVALDGYAQAGIVGGDGFADGAVRIERTVASAGKTRISAGAGVWGGIQPGAGRVDVGPQVVAKIPLENGAIRISAEWRERVAGDAAPRSGPSLTIGMDF